MKKTIVALGIGASLLVTFSSCSSTDVYEPTGNYTVDDGEIPPWLLEGNEDEQIAAAPYSQNRNDTLIPDETQTMANVNGSASSQVQPEHIAQNPPPPTEDMPFIEAPSDPLATGTVVTPQESALATNTKPVVKPQKPVQVKPKPAQTKKPQGKKPAKKFTEPTLITYTVRKGDNLHDIAKRSRTTIAQIKKDSKLKGDTIYPGQVIKVRYIPKDYKPGKKNAAGGSTGKARTHVVAKGETISGIAKKYGVPYTQILKANNMSLKDAAKIRPGKRLTIPAAAKSKKK